MELDEPNEWYVRENVLSRRRLIVTTTSDLELHRVHVCLRKENLRAHLLQAAVISMHQNGRDTHIRQIRVYGPRVSVTKTKHMPQFDSLEMTQYSCLR